MRQSSPGNLSNDVTINSGKNTPAEGDAKCHHIAIVLEGQDAERCCESVGISKETWVTTKAMEYGRVNAPL